MGQKGFTKKDRVATIAKATGIAPKVVESVLNADDEVIAAALSEDCRVYLDNVGTLHRKLVPAAIRFIPTKGEVEIPEHHVIRFRASKTLLERV